MTDDSTGQATATQEVKVEDVGPARKRLTITVPLEVITQRFTHALGTLSTETVIPGFRKGKVPRQLLEKRFGDSIKAEAKNQLIANAYAAVIEEHQLKPLGEPEPVDGLDKLELEMNKPFTFAVEVEVMPSFELPSFEGIEIKKPMLEIADEHIDNELERQCLLYGTPQKVEGTPRGGDHLIGYATATKNDEDEPFFRLDDVPVLYPLDEDKGRGQVLGLMIEGLDKMVKGKGIGDTIEIDTVGPDAHERVDLRGAKIHIEFEIRDVRRVEPAKASEVAEKYGLKDAETLRNQIKVALEHRRNNEQASAMREQATDQLSEKTSIDLPEKVTASQAVRHVEQRRLELLSNGLSPEEAEKHLAEIRSDTEEQTRNRLKKFFLLHRLGEHFGIDVSEQEINARIATIAAQRNVRPDALRSELVQNGQLGEISRLIRDEKAANRLVHEVKKVEVTAEEWNKIFNKSADSNPKTTAKKKTKKKTTKAKG